MGQTGRTQGNTGCQAARSPRERSKTEQSREGSGLGVAVSRGPPETKGETGAKLRRREGAEVVWRSPGEGTNRTNPTGPARRPQGDSRETGQNGQEREPLGTMETPGGKCLLPFRFLKQTGQKGKFFMVGAGIQPRGRGKAPGKGPQGGGVALRVTGRSAPGGQDFPCFAHGLPPAAGSVRETRPGGGRHGGKAQNILVRQTRPDYLLRAQPYVGSGLHRD